MLTRARTQTVKIVPFLAAALICLTGILAQTTSVQAQETPRQRQMRTYIPPEQLVSFEASTPFDQFIAALNPTVERVLGKSIVDPEDRSGTIGVPISSMYFLDALELVLNQRGLTYRETDQYLIVEPAPAPEEEELAGREQMAEGESQPQHQQQAPLATAETREIQIDAVFFELNLTRAREIGVNWNVIFGGGQSGGDSGGTGAGGGTGGSGSNGGQQQGLDFRLKTDEFFDQFRDYIHAPNEVPFSSLTQMFRLFERENLGKTIANPSVTVQSSEEGRIQIGSDIPINIRDFAGNTVTRFVETGVIVNVTPTLISDLIVDTTGVEPDTTNIEFIHLDVQVEKSSGRPSTAGLIVDKSSAETQTLLLDNEQTVIGGLYSTEKTTERKGIPLLKDLPKWFFGLRYVFGYSQTTRTQKELLIALQAKVVDPLSDRIERALPTDLRQKEIRQLRERLDRMGLEPGQLERKYQELPEPRR